MRLFIHAGPEQGGEAWLDQGPSTGRQEAEAVGAIAGAAAEAGDPGDGQGREQDDRPGHLQAQLLGPPYLSGLVSTRRGTLWVTLSDPLMLSCRCKKFKVPIEKIFNKTQRDKFRWAIDMAGADYRF